MSHIILHRISRHNSFLANYFHFPVCYGSRHQYVRSINQISAIFFPTIRSDPTSVRSRWGRIFGIWPFHNRDFSFLNFGSYGFWAKIKRNGWRAILHVQRPFRTHTSSCQFFPKGTKIVMSSRGGKGEIDRRLFMKGWANTVCRNLISAKIRALANVNSRR